MERDQLVSFKIIILRKVHNAEFPLYASEWV